MKKENYLVLEVRDKYLNKVCAVEKELLDLQLTIKFLEVGEFSVTLPKESISAKLLKQAGSGIVVSNEYQNVIFSGIVTNYKQETSIENTKGNITFSGISDLFILQDKAVYADPDNDLQHQSVPYDTYIEKTAEFVIKEVVRKNAGADTLPTRKDIFNEKLEIEPVLDIGDKVISIQARYDNLFEFTKACAIAGNIAFDVIFDNSLGYSRLYLFTYQVNDKSKRIRLDIENNQLNTQDINARTPTMTRVCIMGQGQGIERYIKEYKTTQEIDPEIMYGRNIEYFKDRRDISNDDETKRDEQFLTESNAELQDKDTFLLSAIATPSENNELRLFRDYGVGDVVTVVFDNIEYKTRITGVAISYNKDGYLEALSVGDNTIFTTEAEIVREFSRRILELEKLEKGE
jgi:hypothetical protein